MANQVELFQQQIAYLLANLVEKQKPNNSNQKNFEWRNNSINSNNQNNQNQSKELLRCFKCGKEGHFKRDCVAENNIKAQPRNNNYNNNNGNNSYNRNNSYNSNRNNNFNNNNTYGLRNRNVNMMESDEEQYFPQ